MSKRHRKHKQNQHNKTQHIDPTQSSTARSESHVVFAEPTPTQNKPNPRFLAFINCEIKQEANFFAAKKSQINNFASFSSDDEQWLHENNMLINETRADQKATSAIAGEREKEAMLATKKIVEEVQERFNMNDAESMSRRGIKRNETADFDAIIRAESDARSKLSAKPAPKKSTHERDIQLAKERANRIQQSQAKKNQTLFGKPENTPETKESKQEDTRAWFNPTRALW